MVNVHQWHCARCERGPGQQARNFKDGNTAASQVGDLGTPEFQTKKQRRRFGDSGAHNVGVGVTCPATQQVRSLSNETDSIGHVHRPASLGKLLSGPPLNMYKVLHDTPTRAQAAHAIKAGCGCSKHARCTGTQPSA